MNEPRAPRPRWIPNPRALPRWLRWSPGVLLAVCAVVVAAVGWVRFLSSSTLMATLPRDTSVYLELTSAERAADALLAMGFVDAGAERGQAGQDLVRSVASAFQIPVEDARALAKGLDAAALAARSRLSGPDGALTLRFDRAKPVETLLASSRLAPDGAVGRRGRIYALRARELHESPEQAVPLLERTLSGLELDGTRRAIAWFPDERLLVIGSRSMLEDVAAVVDGKAGSLQKAPGYARRSSKLDRDRAIVGLLDGVFAPPGLLDGEPLAAHVDFTRAGVVLDIQGKPAKPAAPGQVLTAAELDLARRLPTETLAYVVASRRGPLASMAADLVQDELYGLDERRSAALKTKIAALAAKAGLDDGAMREVFALPGVSALVLAQDYRHDPLEGAAALSRRFAVTHLLRVAEPVQAQQILAAVRRAVSEGALASSYRTTDDASGFVAEPGPELELPVVRVVQRSGEILIGVGAPALLERSVRAFADGAGTLAQDPAHQRAFEACAGQHEIYAWLDAGRLATVVLAADAPLGAALADAGLPAGALRLQGPDRLTTALGMGCHADGCRLVGLNLPAAWPLGVAAAHLFRPWLADLDQQLLAGTVGLVDCDALLDRMEACVPAVAESLRAEVHAAIDTSRASWPVLAAGEARQNLAGACRAALDVLGPGAACPGQTALP